MLHDIKKYKIKTILRKFKLKSFWIKILFLDFTFSEKSCIFRDFLENFIIIENNTNCKILFLWSYIGCDDKKVKLWFE